MPILLSLTTDKRLLRKLAQGDECAFEKLFDRYWTKVYALCFHYIKQHEDAADLTQDVFRIIWEKRETLHVNGSVEAYLMVAAKNKVINHFRHRQSKAQHEQQASNHTGKAMVNIADPTFYPALERVYTELVSQLSLSCRRVFELREKEGLSNQQIADRLDLSIKTVEYHLHNARKFLKAKLMHQSDFFHH